MEQQTATGQARQNGKGASAPGRACAPPQRGPITPQRARELLGWRLLQGACPDRWPA